MRPLVWFRSDLRTTDHPALSDACGNATRGVVAVFVICPAQWSDHDWASVRVEFILRTLEELSDHLHRLNIPLLVETADRFDDVPELLLQLAGRHQCDAVYFNREYEVNERRRDGRVVAAFEASGLEARAFTDQVILPPGSLQTTAGDFYSVYTPFRKAWTARVKEQGVPTPLRAPKKQPSIEIQPSPVPEKVKAFPSSNVDAALWPAGESAARKRLSTFIKKGVQKYHERRDLPEEDGTSALSPYLTVGAISIRQCLLAAYEANGDSLEGRSGPGVWISELIWREFYRHILIGFPRISMGRAYREETDRLPWRYDEDEFERWCEGATGFPIVDAAMRQLNQTGWMHNRLRMIAAMFLTKDLFIDWRWGERYFMQRLIDGDLASNNGGWQWSASTGTDAAPYFRIFNPTSQSRKVDPDGAFIRRFCPELADLPPKMIHQPHESPPQLIDSDVADYPQPMVDHAAARDRVIKAFKSIKS